MEKEKLEKIVKHNECKRDEIAEACYTFYRSIGRTSPTIISNMRTVAEIIFADRGFRLLCIPLKNDEIGAFQLKLNGNNFLVLNSAKNLAYNNFSVAHELYHILIQKDDLNSFDIFKEEYSENENELMANAFAGNIIMPEQDFILMWNILRNTASKIEKEQTPPFFDDYFLTIMLMNYFRTTYMSVVVRCFELKLFDFKNEGLVKNLLLNNNKEALSDFCQKYSLSMNDSSIAKATFEDDFESLIKEAQLKGEDKIQRGMLTKKELEYKISGMRNAYGKVVKR